MAKINLLPWRAERRKQREREFYMMLVAAAVAGVLAVLLWSWWMDARIENQESRNQYLTNQIKQLDDKLTEIKDIEKRKAQLLARKQVIEKLQASRSQMVHLFDELVKTIPDGVRLVSMKQNGDTLTLDGTAQSNASVATYMRNLEASPWLAHPDLQKTEAKNADQRHRFEFGLKVKLSNPEEKAKERAAEQQRNAEAAGGNDKSGGRTGSAAAHVAAPGNGGGKP